MNNKQLKQIIAAVIKGDGTWSTVLDTSEADTQLSYTLMVRTLDLSGIEIVTSITDIRLGEVWVCSGQSNMQFTVNQVRIMIKDLKRKSFFALFANKGGYPYDQGAEGG